MKFTYTETPGDRTDFDEYLAGKLKEFAKSRFGIDIDVVITPLPETTNTIEDTPLKETS